MHIEGSACHLQEDVDNLSSKRYKRLPLICSNYLTNCKEHSSNFAPPCRVARDQCQEAGGGSLLQLGHFGKQRLSSKEWQCYYGLPVANSQSSVGAESQTGPGLRHILDTGKEANST